MVTAAANSNANAGASSGMRQWCTSPKFFHNVFSSVLCTVNQFMQDVYLD